MSQKTEGGYVGALAPLSPVGQARQIIASAARQQAAALKQLRRADPEHVAHLVCEHVAFRSSCYFPGEALTVEVEDILQAIGADRQVRSSVPGRHEAITIAALVGLGFKRGTRGKTTVFRKVIAAPGHEARRAPLSFNKAAREAAAVGDVLTPAAGPGAT